MSLFLFAEGILAEKRNWWRFFDTSIPNSVFVYGFLDILKRFEYAWLVKMSKLQLSLCFFLKSFLMYIFQYLSEDH
ncbi:hypothetical protein [Halalkalibacter krulwichiae]|nr:hypothetical protein [Halalkalibacter krulwichiae]